MIAQRSEREKRSFHVGARRQRGLVGASRGLVWPLLALLLAVLPVLPIAAQENDLSEFSRVDVPDEPGGEGAATFLPWPEEGAFGGPDGSPGGEGGEERTRTFDPARLALWPVLRIGMVLDPARGDFSGAEPLRARLEEGLRIPAVVVAFSSLARLQEGLVRGQVDYASLSTTAFVDAQARCSCLEPLAVPLGEEGASGWTLIAIVAKGGGFNGLDDLAAARVALSPEGSTAGRRLPLALLDEAGVSPDETRRVEVAGPVQAVEAVIAGRADVAFGWAPSLRSARVPEGGTLAAYMARHGALPEVDAVPVLGPIPFAPVVVRTDLPQSLRDEMRDLLEATGGPGLPLQGEASRFQRVSLEDFALLAPLAKGGGDTGRGRLRQLAPR